MRELKFRIWKPMLESMNFVSKNSYLSCHGILDEYEGCNDSPIWMQFTGLKDKNGKEIYEGDILHYTICEGTSIPCLIIFKDTAFIIKFGEDDEDILYEYVNKKNITLEVIGNLYQNPELLNV